MRCPKNKEFKIMSAIIFVVLRILIRPMVIEPLIFYNCAFMSHKMFWSNSWIINIIFFEERVSKIFKFPRLDLQLWLKVFFATNFSFQPSSRSEHEWNRVFWWYMKPWEMQFPLLCIVRFQMFQIMLFFLEHQFVIENCLFHRGLSQIILKIKLLVWQTSNLVKG